MFTEAQKKKLVEWKEAYVDNGMSSFSVDSIPANQLAVFQECGIITGFHDYGKDCQKEISIDGRMLTEAVKEIGAKEARSCTMREKLLIERFKSCLEANLEGAERMLRMLEGRCE